MRGRLLIVVAGVLLRAHCGGAQTKPIEGNWRTPTGSIVTVYRCGEKECLKILQIPAGAPERVDSRNPDRKLQMRSLCGLEIGSGFRVTEDRRSADGGSLYDPMSGKTYSGAFIADGDLLKLRGYVGLKIFGRSEEWKRVPEAVQTCQERAG